MKLDGTDRYGLVAWGIFGICITLMATVPSLLIPLAIVVASLMILSVVVYWITTPPHLWNHRRRRRRERARIEASLDAWAKSERAKHHHSV